VAAADESFCDVTARLASLEDSEKPDAAPEVGGHTSPDDSFENFDDLIGATGASERAAHVDFDDLVAEANADDEGDSREVASPDDNETDAGPGHEDFDDLMGEVSVDPDPPLLSIEPIEGPGSELEEQGESPEKPEPVPEKPRRKKKKISFV
jgi:hypothetical protein